MFATKLNQLEHVSESTPSSSNSRLKTSTQRKEPESHVSSLHCGVLREPVPLLRDHRSLLVALRGLEAICIYDPVRRPKAHLSTHLSCATVTPYGGREINSQIKSTGCHRRSRRDRAQGRGVYSIVLSSNWRDANQRAIPCIRFLASKAMRHQPHEEGLLRQHTANILPRLERCAFHNATRPTLL